MSAITGIVSCKRKLVSETENIKKMNDSMEARGRFSAKLKFDDYGLFGCSTMIIPSDKAKQIPFSKKAGTDEYTICFDGLIYNTDEIKSELKQKGIVSDDMDDAELILNLYIQRGAGCLKYLNGIFAFTVWNSETNELFMARDRFGIKPLYYTLRNDSLYFASQLKGLLANTNINPVIDRQGLCEVLGLGPAQTQGCGIFSGINEILPGHFAVFNKNGFNTHRYWQPESMPYDCSFDECLNETSKKVFSAIDSQLNTKGRNMAFFLSGGLDSSAITALAAKKYDTEINTFSLQYKDNDNFFTPTEYQPASDDYYIDLMQQTFGTKHHIITVTTEDLITHLTDAVDARDLPGMADVDSSLYFLCKNIGNDFNGALSGECADEVFGGYPWFHRKEDFDANIFPWAKNIGLRQKLVSPEVMKEEEISSYIYDAYNKSLACVPQCSADNAEEKRRREISFLNLNWFMYTLGARSERIGMNCGLEIRMPFCDHKLVEYVWNIPWEYKTYNGREKGLLRKVFEGLLPDDILWRKKSPFPKTHNPEYEMLIKNITREILSDKNSSIRSIINHAYINKLMEQPSDYGKPWFGQLMALPQLYAYIIQLDYWLKKYNIEIRL